MGNTSIIRVTVAGRVRAAGVTAALVALPTALAGGAAWLSVPSVRAALSASRRLDDLVLAGTGAALVAVLLWLTLAVAAAAVDVLTSAPAPAPTRPTGRHAGRVGRRLAERVSPTLVRRLVAVALGVALGSSAAAAGAAPRVPDAGWSAAAPAVAGTAVIPLPTSAGAVDPAWHAVDERPTTATLRVVDRGGPEHVVHRGDSLWSIAASRLGPHASRGDVLREQQRLYALNAGVVGEDPDVLHPGQVLQLG